MKPIFLGLLLITAQSSYAQWTMEVAPYIWGINLKGNLQNGPIKVEISEPFFDLLKDLDFGAMLGLAAYHDNLGLFFNGMYTKVSDDVLFNNFPINVTSSLSMYNLGASYKMFHTADNKVVVEPYAGARYTSNSNSISIGTYFTDNLNVHWTDAIIGSRIEYTINPIFNIIGSADYGIGNQSNSYNLTGFIGYHAVKHFKHTRFYLGYRFLHQNYHQGQGINYFNWNMDLFGPVLGMLIKF